MYCPASVIIIFQLPNLNRCHTYWRVSCEHCRSICYSSHSYLLYIRETTLILSPHIHRLKVHCVISPVRQTDGDNFSHKRVEAMHVHKLCTVSLAWTGAQTPYSFRQGTVLKVHAAHWGTLNLSIRVTKMSRFGVWLSAFLEWYIYPMEVMSGLKCQTPGLETPVTWHSHFVNTAFHPCRVAQCESSHEVLPCSKDGQYLSDQLSTACRFIFDSKMGARLCLRCIK